MLKKYNIFSFKKTAKTERFKNKKNFISEFFSQPHHKWIGEDKYLKRNFERFLELLPLELINHLWKHHPIAFVPANGTLSCAIHSKDHMAFVLIFSDLAKILRSGYPDRGLAILAHELGHIFYRHHDGRIMDALEAQVEADKFCVMLGLGKELQEVLLDSAGGIEARVRISKITAEYYAG